MRIAVGNFIKLNPDVKINGMALNEAVLFGDNILLDEFKENIVLQNNEDARTVVFAIAPVVLRIQIDIVVLQLTGRVTVFNDLFK